MSELIPLSSFLPDANSASHTVRCIESENTEGNILHLICSSSFLDAMFSFPHCKLHNATPHHTTLHFTTLLYTSQRYTTLHNIFSHSNHITTTSSQDSKTAQKVESKLQVTTQGYLLRAQKLQNAVQAAFDALATVQRDHGTHL